MSGEENQTFRRRVSEAVLLVLALAGFALAAAGVEENPWPWWSWVIVFLVLLAIFLSFEWWRDYRRLNRQLADLRSERFRIREWEGMVANVYRHYQQAQGEAKRVEPILYGFLEWRSLRDAMSEEAHGELEEVFTKERMGRERNPTPIAPAHPFPYSLSILMREISRLEREWRDERR